VRADELGVDPVRQGVSDKLPGVQKILSELGLRPEQTCYIGDDLPDLPVVQFVGLGVAVADACAELRAAAHHTTTAPGGRGAVRELVETMLQAQQRWDGLIKRYYL
jgi:YrbI family 3-deoxy-D-manno-octulosonate 8-phosphate phosphatase